MSVTDTLEGSGGGNIKVVVRCRPMNAREQARGAKCLVQMEGNQTVLHPPSQEDKATKDKERDRKEHAFSFDKSYWSAGSRTDPDYASQQTLYDDVGVELLDHSFAGYNCCIFAYGQTGSGKSYSMMGYGSDKGVIPLVTEALFERIHQKTAADPAMEYRVEVSYMEIYNEKVRDLLNPKNKAVLRVREHPSLGPYVEDLSRLVVESYSQMMTLMDEGNKARTVASTAMNETSSRSHAVFTVILTQKRHDESTKMDGEKVSKVSLVDLAGSERANSTGATGARLKEGANINRSLTTLGKVIQALAMASNSGTKQKKRKDDFVPYRDSVLTWLLKESLGGNSKTCMIAAISPADYEETLSTLRYADQAKRIKTNAVVNEDPNAKLIRELKEELSILRQRAVGGPSEAIFDEATPPEQQIVTYKTKTGELKRVTKLELQENLEASEKIMASLNESWEEKLTKTQKIHADREQALEELGISLNKDQALVGVHAPKRWPHLVNLNEDPLQNECLLYSIPEGTTLVGNTDSLTAAIKLSSPRILDEHCALINENSKVTIRPLSEAAILVNGKPIPTNITTQLESGFRIIIDWHVFRFSSPQSVRAQRMKESASFSGGLCDAVADDVALSETSRDLGPVNVVDWSFARKEALSRLALRGEDLDTLDDDELDELFQDITRARTERKRPDSQTGTPSRLRNITTFDTESVPDVNVRQLDDVDKDDNPWIVNPSGHSNLSDRVPAQLFSESIERSESESSWSAARRLKHAPQESMEVSRMAEEIRRLRQITLQNRFESLSSRLDGVMNDRDKSLTALAITRRRKLCIVGMARTMRDKTDSVVEANMLAKRQGIDIHYRIIATSGTPVSSLEPHVESVLFDAEATHTVTRSSPSVAVLVVDLSKSLSYTWSFEKLDRQLLMMRAITKDKQSAHEPNHKSAFVTLPYPRFTHLGSAMFALHPRAAGNMTVPIQCCVDADAIGTLEADVSWQQTTNQVDVRDKFFTVTVSLAQVRAFTSDVDRAHMQLRVPVFGIGGKRESVYTSKNIDLPGGSSSQLRLKETFQLAASAFQEQLYVVVDFFGEVERLYLERLLNRIPYIPASPNDNETRRSAGDVTIKHTLAIHLAILELNSQGEFTPTEFDRNDQVFLLRQGRQRHLEIRILHDSARALDFKDVVFITIKSQQASESAIIHLAPLKDPSTIYHPDGRGELRVVCKLEDVTGMEKKMNGTESLPCQLSFQVGFEGYNAPALFVQSLRVRILGRESRRRSSLMDYLRVKSFGPDMSRIFQIVLPDESRSQITGSQVAIIASYLERRHRQHLVADVQSMKALLTTVQPITHVHGKSRDEQQRAVSLCVKAWQSRMETTRLPSDLGGYLGARLARGDRIQVSESPVVSRTEKEGWLDVLVDPAAIKWETRWARLTRPYLRLTTANDLREETHVLCLENAHLSRADELEMILETRNIFSVAGMTITTVFRSTTTNERDSWLNALDRR